MCFLALVALSVSSRLTVLPGGLVVYKPYVVFFIRFLTTPEINMKSLCVTNMTSIAEISAPKVPSMSVNGWSKLGFHLQYTLIKEYKKHRHLSHAEIVSLHRRLRSGSYQFGRMFRLFIPKAPGKVGLRPITIPHRHDRALLRALHLTLTEALSPLMSPCSHGFLPHRGCLSLYADLCNFQGVHKMKFMDVTKCFDTMSHAKVREQLSFAGAPPEFIKLILSCLSY